MGKSNVKISSVRTLCLSRLHERERQWSTSFLRIIKADAAIVVLETDEGLLGIAEATPYGGPFLVRAEVARLSEALVGQDPLRVSLPEPPFPGPPLGRFPHIRPVEAALAGLDCALWDLRGKIAGKPVAQLISESAARDIEVYASTGVRHDWRGNSGGLATELTEAEQQGYRHAKVRLGTDWAADGVTVARFLDRLARAMADHPGLSVAVDGNCRLDLPSAREMSKGLADLGCAWFEEPMPLDLARYRELRRTSRLPISGGESLASLPELSALVEGGAFDIVQPDVAVTGITTALRVAEIAASRDVEVCTHSWHNDLMTAANANFMAGIGATRPLERCMVQGPLQTAVLDQPLDIAGGRLSLSGDPGFGVGLGADLEARFPHIEGHYAIEVTR